MCNNLCQLGCFIAHTHTFTAAHCIKYRDRPEVKAEAIVLYVGKYNLQDWSGTNNQPRDVSQLGPQRLYKICITGTS